MADTATTTVPQADQELARVEPNPRWIRGHVDGQTIVDSRDSLFVWEFRYYPQWYFPISDLAAELRPTGDVEQTKNRGDATVYDIVVPAADGRAERVLPAAARRHLDSPIPELRDRVRILWDSIDRWFEEEVEVFVHPRSPYVRLDILPSTRRVTIKIDGTVVAESSNPSILYETGLPSRYYLPAADVRRELLTPTETSSACPYKGVAKYWNVTIDGTVHQDIVWGYDNPLPESADAKDLMCFYNEKVDIELDGKPLTRPKTKFS